MNEYQKDKELRDKLDTLVEVLLHREDVLYMYKDRLTDTALFKGMDGYRKIVDAILDHFNRHGKLPTREMVQKQSKQDEIGDPKFPTDDSKEWFDDQFNDYYKQCVWHDAVTGMVDNFTNANYGAMQTFFDNAKRKCFPLEATGVRLTQDIDAMLGILSSDDRYSDTGYPTLNETLGGGWVKGHLNLIISRSNGGKTLVKQNLALKLATNPVEPLNVLWISLEMDDASNFERFAKMVTGMSRHEIASDHDKVRQLMSEKMTHGEIVIQRMEADNTSTADIREKVLSWKYQGVPIGAVVVDYANLMCPNDKSKEYDMHAAARIIGNELKQLGEDEDLVILTSSQLNREGARLKITPEGYKDNPNLVERAEQYHIAYGKTLWDCASNVIAVYPIRDDEDHIAEYQFQFPKMRDAERVGAIEYFGFDSSHLEIFDNPLKNAEYKNRQKQRKKDAEVPDPKKPETHVKTTAEPETTDETATSQVAVSEPETEAAKVIGDIVENAEKELQAPDNDADADDDADDGNSEIETETDTDDSHTEESDNNDDPSDSDGDSGGGETKTDAAKVLEKLGVNNENQ